MARSVRQSRRKFKVNVSVCSALHADRTAQPLRAGLQPYARCYTSRHSGGDPHDRPGDGQRSLAPHLHQRCHRGGRHGIGVRISVPHHNPRPERLVAARIGRTADHARRQRPAAPRRRAETRNAGDDAALQAGADRHQARVRPLRVRRVHGAHRRCAALLLLDPHAQRARAEGADRRRAGQPRRQAQPGAAGRATTARASSAPSA